MYFVFAQELVERPLFVFQVAEESRLSGTILDAGRLPAVMDTMITQGAFVRDACDRIQEACAVRSGLNAVSAADTVFGIDKHCAIWSFKRRADGTNLHARRMFARIAEFRDKERFVGLFLALAFE